jgi:PEP-CTERM motif
MNNKKMIRIMLGCVVLSLALAIPVQAQQTSLAFWNFNDAPNPTPPIDQLGRNKLFSPDSGLYAGAATMTTSTGFVFSDGATTSPRGIASITGITVADPLVSPVTAGFALLVQAQGNGSTTGIPNNGGQLIFTVPTIHYDNIKVSFAAQRNTNGFASTSVQNLFEYSLDSGLTWSSSGLTGGGLYTAPTSFALQGFDLSGIPGINNLPSAQFRITLNGATGATGNNRFDNLLISGTPITSPEPTTLGLLAFGSIGLLRHKKHRK